MVQVFLKHFMAKEQDPYGWMMLAALGLSHDYGTVSTMELVYTTASTLKMLVYSAVQVCFVGLGLRLVTKVFEL